MNVYQSKQYQNHILLLTLLFGSVCFVASVSAEDSSVTQLSDAQKQEREQKQDQIDAINAKIKAYKQIIDLKQRQGSTLADQIVSLETQVSKLELEIKTNKEKITSLEEEAAILSSRIKEKELLFNNQKQILSELMRVYYSDYSDGKAVLVFSSDETLSFLSQENWTTEVGNKISDLLDSVRTLKESLIAERASLYDKKKEADDLHAKLTTQNDYLESTKTNKAQLLAKTQAEATKYDTLVGDLQKERDEIENEISSLESGKLDELNLKDMPSFKHGLLAYPFKTHTVSQGYGKTRFAQSSGFYKNGFHNGLDFAAPVGTSVMAAADGKVVAIGNNGKYAYGRYIAIDHGNGIVTMYGHLSAYKVSRGQTVKEGDVIAKSGNTGNSTGPHLHFTVFSAKSFDIVASKIVSSLKDIPVGATVNPSVYLP
jgi:murein DD-endopeptidase MepM/ murein hydrolase activator NlpD